MTWFRFSARLRTPLLAGAPSGLGMICGLVSAFGALAHAATCFIPFGAGRVRGKIGVAWRLQGSEETVRTTVRTDSVPGSDCWNTLPKVGNERYLSVEVPGWYGSEYCAVALPESGFAPSLRVR